MRLLPLMPSISSKPWAAGQGTSCRFCGFTASASTGFVAQDSVTACALCQASWRLSYDTAAQEMALIWLPCVSQSALNCLVRAIHLTFYRSGEAAHMASKPSHDTHELRAAYRAYAALAEQTAPLQSRIGLASPQELAAALMGLAPEDYERRVALLGGIRILHRGRRFEDGRDVYPEILESWS